ncbi:hypothetical protein R6Q59_029642 [Mikania micrantha]
MSFIRPSPHPIRPFPFTRPIPPLSRPSASGPITIGRSPCGCWPRSRSGPAPCVRGVHEPSQGSAQTRLGFKLSLGLLARLGLFSNQGKATRIIGETLQAFWSHPWTSWKDVSKEDENMMFDRFKDKLLVRRATVDEIWIQSHGKKGTRPLDKLLISKGGEGSQKAGNLDEIDLLTTVKWVDTRAKDSLVKRSKMMILEGN